VVLPAGVGDLPANGAEQCLKQVIYDAGPQDHEFEAIQRATAEAVCMRVSD